MIWIPSCKECQCYRRAPRHTDRTSKVEGESNSWNLELTFWFFKTRRSSLLIQYRPSPNRSAVYHRHTFSVYLALAWPKGAPGFFFLLIIVMREVESQPPSWVSPRLRVHFPRKSTWCSYLFILSGPQEVVFLFFFGHFFSVGISLVWTRRNTSTFVTRVLCYKFSGTRPISCLEAIDMPALQLLWTGVRTRHFPDARMKHYGSSMLFVMMLTIYNRPCLVVGVVDTKHCKAIFSLFLHGVRY